jgi:hypothetical protein
MAAMMEEAAGPVSVPCDPGIDANGVDRAQIREMLALTPAERMLAVQKLADSIAEIRRLDGTRALR